MTTYPSLTWHRSGPLHSCILRCSPADALLVAEAIDSGDDSAEKQAHRFGVRWLAGGPQDRAQVGSLDEAKAWVRGLVVVRMCAL